MVADGKALVDCFCSSWLTPIVGLTSFLSVAYEPAPSRDYPVAYDPNPRGYVLPPNPANPPDPGWEGFADPKFEKSELPTELFLLSS